MAKIQGTPNADVLPGTVLADSLYGLAGNDLLKGGAGDDLMSGGSGDDRLFGEAGGDSLHGDVGADVLDGGTGFDWALYLDGATAGVQVYLYQRRATGGAAQGDTLFNIEGVQGTAFADILHGDIFDNSLLGNGGADRLYGREGNDQLNGGAGADILDGGTGLDWALYGDAASAVVVSLVNNLNAGGAAGDKLFAIENVQGSRFADTLTGNTLSNVLEGGAGNDKLYGREGDDQLRGGAGADRLDGATGVDWAIYDDATLAVNVSLALNRGLGGAAGDTYFSIENIQGSKFNDVIQGNALANTLNGGAGNDQLYGLDGDDFLTGGPGGDRLDGGNGIDWALYRQGATAGVIVSLFNNANAGGAAGDTLFNIENVQGTDFADTINASTQSNFLSGHGGADKLFGREGDDQLQGGLGADWLDGGAGNDWAYYDDSATGAIVNLLTNVHAAGADGDKLFAIENVQGTAFADNITGDGNGNVLAGGAGNDVLSGGLGNDQLIGGSGGDFLDGGAGTGDWALYRDGATQGITLYLANNALNDRGALGDRLFNIEFVQGTNFSDIIHGSTAENFITGNAGDDFLYGEAGDDQLQGGPGADWLDGGDGIDWVLYRDGATAGVTVWLANNGLNTGDATGDNYFNIENVQGTDFADTIHGTLAANFITGNGGADALFGEGGNDNLAGGAGGDTLNGGDGIDWALYREGASERIVVDLAGITQNAGAAIGDTLTAIENVQGTDFNDIIWGSAGTVANTLSGGLGNDELHGRGGSDVLLGGAGDDQLFDEVAGDAADSDIFLPGEGADIVTGDGNDQVEYSDSLTGVTVDLTQSGPSQTGGGAGSDTLIGILGITGSDHGDVLTSSLTGNGSDIAVIRGLAGDDLITLNHASDRGIGGDGIDTIILKAASQFADGGAGNDILNASLATGARLTGGAGNDTMTGNATAVDQFTLELLAGFDSITNFLQSNQGSALGRDILVIDLSNFGFGVTFEASELVSAAGATAAGTNAQLIYDETTQDLWYDIDGTTAANAAVKIAHFDAGPAHLTLNDFGTLL